MKKVLEQLDNIQFDHLRWLNELIFSVKEIEFYQNRLTELLNGGKEKSEELSVMFEEFENQKKQAIEIQSEIKKHTINISQLSHSNGELKVMINTDHKKAREEMETFRYQYANLKENFHRFSALQN